MIMILKLLANMWYPFFTSSPLDSSCSFLRRFHDVNIKIARYFKRHSRTLLFYKVKFEHRTDYTFDIFDSATSVTSNEEKDKIEN